MVRMGQETDCTTLPTQNLLPTVRCIKLSFQEQIVFISLGLTKISVYLWSPTQKTKSKTYIRWNWFSSRVERVPWRKTSHRNNHTLNGLTQDVPPFIHFLTINFLPSSVRIKPAPHEREIKTFFDSWCFIKKTVWNKEASNNNCIQCLGENVFGGKGKKASIDRKRWSFSVSIRRK